MEQTSIDFREVFRLRNANVKSELLRENGRYHKCDPSSLACRSSRVTDRTWAVLSSDCAIHEWKFVSEQGLGGTAVCP